MPVQPARRGASAALASAASASGSGPSALATLRAREPCWPFRSEARSFIEAAFFPEKWAAVQAMGKYFKNAAPQLSTRQVIVADIVLQAQKHQVLECLETAAMPVRRGASQLPCCSFVIGFDETMQWVSSMGPASPVLRGIYDHLQELTRSASAVGRQKKQTLTRHLVCCGHLSWYGPDGSLAFDEELVFPPKHVSSTATAIIGPAIIQNLENHVCGGMDFKEQQTSATSAPPASSSSSSAAPAAAAPAAAAPAIASSASASSEAGWATEGNVIFNADKSRVLGKFIPFGYECESLAVQCKFHQNCKRAASTRKYGGNDRAVEVLCTWLVAGIGLNSAADHKALARAPVARGPAGPA